MSSFKGTYDIDGVSNEQNSFKNLIKDKWGSIESMRNCDIDDKYETPFRYIDVEEKNTQTITRTRQSEHREPTIIDIQHEQELKLLYGTLHKPYNSDAPKSDSLYNTSYSASTSVRQSEQKEPTIIDLYHEKELGKYGNPQKRDYSNAPMSDNYSNAPKSDRACTAKYVDKLQKYRKKKEETGKSLVEKSEREEKEKEELPTRGKVLVYAPEYENVGEFEDL